MTRSITFRILVSAAAAGLLAAGCSESGRSKQRAARSIPPKPTAAGTFSAKHLTQHGLEMAWKFQTTREGVSRDKSALLQLHLSGASPAEYNTLYAQTADYAVYAVDLATGTPLWMNHRIPGPLTVPPSQTDRNLFLVHGDTLYVFDVARKPERVDDDGRVLSLFKPSGELRYRLPLAFIPSTAAASNDRFVAFGSSTGDIYSIPIYRIDAAIEEGKIPPLLPSLIQWRHPSQGIVHQPLWCPRTKTEGQARDTLVASMASGRLLKCSLSEFKTDGVGAWEFLKSGRFACGPFVHRQYIVTGSLDHSIYVLDAVDGYYLGGIDLGGPIRTSPVMIGQAPERFRIYANADGKGFCQVRVDDPHHIRHTTEILEPNLEGELKPIATIERKRWLMSVTWRIPASLQFVAEGLRSLYLWNEKTSELLAVDPATGAEQWKQKLAGVSFILTHPADPTDLQPTSPAPRIVLGTPDGTLYCFREL